jgi:hypothetical protein
MQTEDHRLRREPLLLALHDAIPRSGGLAWGEHLVSRDQFTIIVLPWFVLQLTGSCAAVGLVILCFDPPGVVTGAILGRLLDRYQPRLVMGFDNLARAALIATIPTL